MSTRDWTIFGVGLNVCTFVIGLICLGVGILALVISLTPLELRWNDSTNGASTADTDSPAKQQEDLGQQQQQQTENGNAPPPPEPPNLDGIADDERICASPVCPEQYVVKVVGNQRFKRLLLTHDVVTLYEQFDDTAPLHVSQDVLDAFETSCIVWFDDGGNRVYYHFDARPGTDDGDKRRIAATELDLRNAGIASAAFEIDEEELDYFADAGVVTLAEAMRLPCIG